VTRPLALVGVFLRRDVRIARSYRFPFWIQLVTSAGILLVINRVGSLVDPGKSSDRALQAGFFAYVLVGMAVLQFVNAALVSFTNKLREEQVTGTFAALLTTPASPPLLALSLAAYEVLQGVGGFVLLIAVGGFTGAHYDVTAVSVLAAVVDVVALVGVSAAVGVLVAAFTVVFKRGSALAGLVSAAVILLAGIYFPVAQLPGWVRWAAEADPFAWGITGLRSAVLLGEVDGWRVGGTAIAAVVLVPVGLSVFRRSVDRARRQGTLEQY
jgi:ABC-2 type transport system permease protein